MQSSVRVPFCSSVSVGEGLLVTLRKEDGKDIPTVSPAIYIITSETQGNLGSQPPSVCNWYLVLNLGNM